jgi:hypothetical protein
MEKDAPKLISAKNRANALKKLDCEICELFEVNQCGGVVLVEGEEPEKKPNIKKANLFDIPGLTPETDAEIRKSLHKLATVQAHSPCITIAPQLAAAYAEDIQAVRKQGHGWGKIVKIFRDHGIKIGEKSLMTKIEG